jgi:hypothetical protein
MECHIGNHLRSHKCNKIQQQLGPIDTVWNNSTSFPPPQYVDDSIPFAEGLKLIVEIDINPRGTTDDYIKDLISLIVDTIQQQLGPIDAVWKINILPPPSNI